MTDKELRTRVKEHYEEAAALYPEANILCIALQGSQNYYLDDAESDVDTKVLLIPSLKDIVINRKPVSTTHVRANNEHIDVKDIRLYWEYFKKGNPNFVEILFSRVVYVNPEYEFLWWRLVAAREDIARFKPMAAAKAMMGMVNEKWCSLDNTHPCRALDKDKYDPKQLAHLIRMSWFLEQYVDETAPYEDIISLYQPIDCLGNCDEGWRTYLKDVKRGRLYDADEAYLVASYWKERAETAYDKAKEVYTNDASKPAAAILDDVLYKIIEKALRIELGEA